MAKATLINMDTAGGLIFQNQSQSHLFVGGREVALNGARVMPHGEGIHAGAVMVASGTKLFVRGVPVVKEGDSATCGHKSTGSGKLNL